MNTTLSPYHADQAEFARWICFRIDTIEHLGEKRIVKIMAVDLTNNVKVERLA
jgi:hypothetical protein